MNDSDITRLRNQVKFVTPRDLGKILKWMKECNPTCTESFYQRDDVQELLPELGVICFELMTSLGLYSPETED